MNNQFQTQSKFLRLATQARRSDAENNKLLELFGLLGVEIAQKAARVNSIEALVGTVLRDLLGPNAIGIEWDEFVVSNEARVRRLMEATSLQTQALEDAGIAHAAVESAGVMLGSNLPFSALGSGDIDILVSKEGFIDAVTVFQAAGFQYDNRRDRPTARCEMKRTESDGVTLWVNVFSQPFDRMWLPLIWCDQTDCWLERRIPSHRWAGINVLRVEDALAFVSMHTSLHSYIRSPGLRLHVDVDRLACDNAVDWNEYISQVRAMAIQKRAYFSIELAQELISTPIPVHVLAALAPARYVRWSVRHLLDTNGVIADNDPKLTRWQAPLLDLLIHDGGFFSWLQSVFLPPEAWLREHFEQEEKYIRGIFALHLERYRRLFKVWDPK